MFDRVTGRVTLPACGRAVHLSPGSESGLYARVSAHTVRSELQLGALAPGRAHLALHRSCSWEKDLGCSW